MKSTKLSLLSILFMVIVVGVIYFVITSRERPYQILTPKDSAPGTTISLYKNLPPNFPKEVILEETVPNSAAKVSVPKSDDQITVSYKSDKKVEDLIPLYESNFTSNGWVIVKKSVQKVGFVSATKGQQKLILTVAPIQTGSMLTFQYEK